MRKKILNFILLITLGLVSLLAGCTETKFNENMKIVPSEQSINITLGRQYDEDLPLSTRRFTVDISDADDSTVLMEYGNNIKVEFESGYGTENVVATVKGLTAGTSRITVYSPNNSDKKAYITVRVFSAIETLAFKDDFNCMIEVGKKGFIDVTKDLTIFPQDGNKDDIVFEIVGDPKGATINEKTGEITAPNQVCDIKVKISVKDNNGSAYTEDIETVRFVKGITKSDITVRNKATAASINLAEGIRLVKTMEQYATTQIYFDVNSDLELDIKLLNEPKAVAVKDLGAYTFDIASTSLGNDYLNFSVKVKGAGDFVQGQTIILPIEVIDSPTDLNVNGQSTLKNPKGFKLNIYNSYDNSLFGTEVRFTITPSSVLEKDSQIFLSFTEGTLVDNKLVVMNDKGESLGTPSAGFTIVGGTSIYIAARPEVSEGIFHLQATVLATREYKVDDKEIVANIELTVKEGATALNFNTINFADDGYLYIDRDSEGEEISLYLEPDTADYTEIKFESSTDAVEIVELSSMVYRIVPKKVGISRLTFVTENGRRAECLVRVYVPLDTSLLRIDCDSPHENGAVAEKSVDKNGQLKKVVVASGKSIQLKIITNPDADYYVEYINLKANAARFTISNTGLLAILDKFSEQLATVMIYPINAEPIQLKFLVEGFVPISSISFNTLHASLKTADTVGGSYIESLSTLSLKLRCFPQTASAIEDINNIEWSFDGTILTVNETNPYLNLTAVAETLTTSDSAVTYITAKVKEYSKTYSVTCEVVVTDATPVDDIILNNVINNNIYFDGRQGLAKLNNEGNLIDSSVELFFELDYSVKPANADNKTIKLIYQSVDGRQDVPNEERVFTIDRYGRIVPLKAGNALLLLAPEDQIDAKGVPAWVKTIKIIVADGKSRSTALRVSSKSDLLTIGTSEETMSLCYMLANDINLSDDGGKNWTPIGADKGLTFTGELTGAFRLLKDYPNGDVNDLSNFDVLYYSKIYGLKFTEASLSCFPPEVKVETPEGEEPEDTAVDYMAGLFYSVGTENPATTMDHEETFNGLICDLTLEASVSIDISSSEHRCYDDNVYFGAFAGKIAATQKEEWAGIVNCSVKYSNFNFKTGKGDTYIGGAVGYSLAYINTTVSYQDEVIAMNITPYKSTSKLYIGGVVGYGDTKIFEHKGGDSDFYVPFRTQIVGSYHSNTVNNSGNINYIFGDGITYADTTVGIKINVDELSGEFTSNYVGIGGIVGYLSTYSLVKNVAFDSSITATSYRNVGGIAGDSVGQIEEVYSSAKITATRNVGGIVGNLSGNQTIDDEVFIGAYEREFIELPEGYEDAPTPINPKIFSSKYVRLAFVENYNNQPTNNTTYLIDASSEAGGIVGIATNATIEYSYAINFLRQNDTTYDGFKTTGANIGAIVGIMTGTRVESCYTDFGQVNFIGGYYDTADYDNIVTNCLSRYAFNFDDVTTSYIRGYNGNITIYNNTGVTQSYTRESLASAGLMRVFGEAGFMPISFDETTEEYSGKWYFHGSSIHEGLSTNVNDGLPIVAYNDKLIINVAQEKLEITIKETSNVHIKINETSKVDGDKLAQGKKVILYFYDFDGEKSAAINQTLKAKNTFDILDVISINVSPNLFDTVRLKVSFNSVNSTGADTNGTSLIVLENGKLRTRGEGLVKITVSSVYNPSASDFFYAYIVKRIQNFTIYNTLNPNSTSFQYQGNATLNIRKDNHAFIYPTIESSDENYTYSTTELFGVRYSIPLDQYGNITFGSYPGADHEDKVLNYARSYLDNDSNVDGIVAAGQLKVHAGHIASDKNYVIAEPYYLIKFPSYAENGDYEGLAEYRVFFSGVGEVKNKSFYISIYEGAFEITSKIQSVTYSPSDTVTIDLTIRTDIASDSLLYTVDGEWVDTLDVVKLQRLGVEEIVKEGNIKEYLVKYRATVSLQYDYESRYFREDRLFTFKFYSSYINEVSIEVPVIFTPQKLGRIDLQFYSSFDEVSTKPSTNEVKRKTPGLIMIDLYPFYANTDYVEIVSENVGGVYLNFEQVQYQTYDKYYKTVTPSGVIVESGLGLRLRKISEEDDFAQRFTGKYYIRTQLSTDIDQDMLISFTVNAYTLNKQTGKYEKTHSVPMTLLAKESDSITVEVVDTNGLNYVVKGLTSKIKVTLKGEYSKLAYEGGFELMNNSSLSKQDKDIFSEDTLKEIFYNPAKDGNWLTPTCVEYYDTIYVGMGISSGTKIAINVKLNNIKEGTSVTTQTTLTVVDFLIEDIKLSTTTFNSYTNSARIKLLEYYKIGVESVSFHSAPNYVKATEQFTNLYLGMEQAYNNYYLGYLSDGKNIIEIVNESGGYKLKVRENYLSTGSGYADITDNQIAQIEGLKLELNRANRFFINVGKNLLDKTYVSVEDQVNSILTADLEEGTINVNSFVFIDGVMQKIGEVREELFSNISILSFKDGASFVGISDAIDYSKYSFTITSKEVAKNDISDVKDDKDVVYYMIGKSVSSNEMLKLNVKYFFNADGEFILANGRDNVAQYIDITKEYKFNIESISDFDDPFPIYSAKDLMEMEEGESYILMNNLTLTDWEPLDVDISSFDGNGFVIKIKSFAYDTAGDDSVELGLFTDVKEGMLVKNVTVNIHELEVLDLQNFKEITVGFIAANNYGIITNCVIQGYDNKINTTGFGFKAVVTSVVNNEMVVTGYMNSMYKQYSVEIKSSQAIDGDQVSSTVGLLVATNEGSITHSRVGSVSSTAISAEYDTQITVKASGVLGGLVAVNNGQIASSYVSNIYILNSSAVAGESKTAGFVAENSGRISTSYVKGSDSYDKKTSSSTFLRAISGGIMSNGAIGGFVYENSGDINDSYSNISIQSYSSRTAGFVITNSGTIKNCYSASEVGSNSLSHTPFTGFNAYSDIDNTGTIERSFYMEGREDKYIVENYGELASKVPSSEFGSETSFNGFSFSSTDYVAVWDEISIVGYPELTAANNVAFSQRIRSESGEIITDASGNVLNVSLYEYTSERLGGSTNPYIIRNAAEYNYYFNTDATTSKDGELVISEKYFRIVNDIDFDEVAGELASKAMVLNACNIEGNDFTLANIRINADKDEQVNSVGLFKRLVVNSKETQDNTGMLNSNSATEYCGIVKNLTLSLSEANAVGVNYVGALAGIIDGYNVFNINIVAASNDLVIQGKNIVGGLAGYITGNSKIFTINSSVSVQATYKNASQTVPDYFSGDVYEVSELSHAGGIAGVVDVTDKNVYAEDEISLIDNANIKFIKVTGNVEVYADYVGGLFGYFGKNSHLLDGRFYVSNKYTQSIYSGYAAGGLVGINFGVINHSVVEHERETQKVIDEEIYSYLVKGTSYKKDTTLYQGTPTYMGGIAGINYLGFINYSYSRIDVYDPAPKDTSVVVEQYVGGLAGRTVAGTFKQSYATSDVLSKNNNYSYAGGLFGRMEAYASQEGILLDYIYPTFDGSYLLNVYDKANASYYSRNDGRNFGLIAGYSTFDISECVIVEEQEGEGESGETTGKSTIDLFFAPYMEAGQDGQVLYCIDTVSDGFHKDAKPVITNFIGAGKPYQFKLGEADDIIFTDLPNDVRLCKILSLTNAFEPTTRGGFFDAFEEKQWIKTERMPYLSLESLTDITIIKTAEEFLQIKEATGKIFQVANDIDLSGYEFTNYVINKNFSGILRSSAKNESGEQIPVTISGIYLFSDGTTPTMGIFPSTRRAQFININFEFAAFDSTKTVLMKDGAKVYNNYVVLNTEKKPQELAINGSHIAESETAEAGKTYRNTVSHNGRLKQVGGISGFDESSLYNGTTVTILNEDIIKERVDSYVREINSIILNDNPRTQDSLIGRIQELVIKLKGYANRPYNPDEPFDPTEKNVYTMEYFIGVDNTFGIMANAHRASHLKFVKQVLDIDYIGGKYVTTKFEKDASKYTKMLDYLETVGENPMNVVADLVGGFSGSGQGSISITNKSAFIGKMIIDATKYEDDSDGKSKTDVVAAGSLFGTAKNVKISNCDFEDIDINIKTTTTGTIHVAGVIGSATSINVTSESGDVVDVNGKIDVQILTPIQTDKVALQQVAGLYLAGFVGQVSSGNFYNLEIDVPITVSTIKSKGKNTNGDSSILTTYVGGFAGLAKNTNIYNSIINAKFVNKSVETRSGEETIKPIGLRDLYMGGLAGKLDSSNVLKSQVVVDITENWNANEIVMGGLVGEMHAYSGVGNSYQMSNIFVAGNIDTTLLGYEEKKTTTTSIGGIIGRNLCDSVGSAEEGIALSECYLSQVTSNVNIDFDMNEEIKTDYIVTAYLGGIIGAGIIQINKSMEPALALFKLEQCTSLGKINAGKERDERKNLTMYAGGIAGILHEKSEIHCSLTGTSLLVFGYGDTIGDSGQSNASVKSGGQFVDVMVGRIRNGGRINNSLNVACLETSGITYSTDQGTLPAYVNFYFSQAELIAYLTATFPKNGEEPDKDNQLKVIKALSEVYTSAVGSKKYDITDYWKNIKNGYIEFTTSKEKVNFKNTGEFVYNPYIVDVESNAFVVYEFAGIENDGDIIRGNKVSNDILLQEKFFLLDTEIDKKADEPDELEENEITLNTNLDIELKGVFNGNYRLINIDPNSFTSASGETYGLFNKVGNTAILANITVSLSGNGRTILPSLGVVAGINNGIIQNVYTVGKLTTASSISGQMDDVSAATLGGIVAVNSGKITTCQSDIEFYFNGNRDITLGGAVGKNLNGEMSYLSIVGNIDNDVEYDGVKFTKVGALAGVTENSTIYTASVGISISNFKARLTNVLTKSSAFRLYYDKINHIVGVDSNLVTNAVYSEAAKTTETIQAAVINNAKAFFTQVNDYNYDYPYLKMIDKFEGNVYGLLSSGIGEASAPEQITNLYRLQRVDTRNANHNSGSRYYILKYNLAILSGDLEDDINNKGKLKPIGSDSTPFTGNFNGNNKYIRNIKVSRVEVESDKATTFGLFTRIDGKNGRGYSTKIYDLTLTYAKDTTFYAHKDHYGNVDSHSYADGSRTATYKYFGVTINYQPFIHTGSANTTSYTISIASRTGSLSRVGLLAGVVENAASIENITIDGGGNDVYAYYAGGVVGQLTNKSSLTNVSVSNVNVYGEHGIGYYSQAEIDDSEHRITKTLNDIGLDWKTRYMYLETDYRGRTGSPAGYAAGIVAYSDNSVINNCSVKTSTITAGHGGDGAVGRNDCYLDVFTYYSGGGGVDKEYYWAASGSCLPAENLRIGMAGGDGGSAGYAGGFVGYFAKGAFGAFADNDGDITLNGGTAGNGGNGTSGVSGSNGWNSGVNVMGRNGTSGGAGGNGGKGSEFGRLYAVISGMTKEEATSKNEMKVTTYQQSNSGNGGTGGARGGGGTGSSYWAWFVYRRGRAGHDGDVGPGGTNGHTEAPSMSIITYATGGKGCESEAIHAMDCNKAD